MINDYPRVTLVSHSCIQVDYETGILLCDPWFSGAVFDDSWSLLAPAASDKVDWPRLKFIWISHEHPDHLHFPTLRAIRDKMVEPPTVLYRAQPNKNVVKSIAALGFRVVELPHGVKTRLADGLFVTSYDRRGDSTLAINTGGRLILNQNDCRLSARQARALVRTHGRPDLWLFQFSLSGYYANADDEAGLTAARTAHLAIIRSFVKILRPTLFLPFASFVSFCRERNAYLNRWRISPREAAACVADLCASAILTNGEAVRWGDQDPRRSDAAVAYWARALGAPVLQIPEPGVAPDELVRLARRFLERMGTWPRLALPSQLRIQLADLQQSFLLNFREKIAALEPSAGNAAIAEMTAHELAFLLRFPWGADTINITACVRVLDEFRWRWLLYLKHADYKLSKSSGPWQFVPLLLAFWRSYLKRNWYQPNTSRISSV